MKKRKNSKLEYQQHSGRALFEESVLSTAKGRFAEVEIVSDHHVRKSPEGHTKLVAETMSLRS